MNYFTSKINTIRDQTITMKPSAAVSHQIVHYRSPEEQFHSFSTIGEEELYKLDKSAKSTTCMFDPIPSKLLKEVLPEVIDPLWLLLIRHCHYGMCNSPGSTYCHNSSERDSNTSRRGIISITSAVWSTSRLSTRAATFHALHVTLGIYHQETCA